MNNYTDYFFADLWVLWLLLLVPVLWVFYFFRKNARTNSLQVSSSQFAAGIKPKRVSVNTVKYVIRTFAFVFFIIALARPQIKIDETLGIDIMIALDASGSMDAPDFIPNRFEAAKKLAQEFVENRKNDRIGLVIFEGEAYTQCPLTIDKKVVSDIIGQAQQSLLDGRTAIGLGLATAINRLRESDAESKVIILLTDGVNTDGNVDPLVAAKYAVEYKIRVYTIGVGSLDKVKTPIGTNPFTGDIVYDYIDAEIDEPLLKEISSMTGGKYFRATDNEKLKAIYSEIDTLEKHIIISSMANVDYPEKNLPFILIGLALLFIEFLIGLLIKTLS